MSTTRFKRKIRKKMLGIDYGLRRIGLAISDENKFMSLPLVTIDAGASIDASVINLITYLGIRLDELEGVVIGLPLHLDGNESPMSIKAKEFAKKIEENPNFENIKISFFDERLTSAFVDNSLKSLNVSRKKRAKVKDNLAASVLLQNFLDCQKNS
jgi:putative holliday junction resolvase